MVGCVLILWLACALFALLLGVSGRLCSKIVALPGHILYVSSGHSVDSLKITTLRRINSF